MNQILHFQAEQIDQVFASRGLPSRITGGTVTPRLVRFQIATPMDIKVGQLAGLSEEIAHNLGTPSCRVYCQEGQDQVQVEVPRSDAPAVPLLSLCRRLVTEGPRGRDTVPPVTAVLGLDQDGAPMLLRFPSPNVNHVLVAGMAGAGKTSLARTIVTSLALFNSQRDLQLVIIDSKGCGVTPFEEMPHLLVPVVTHADEAVPVLQRLVDEMERRDATGRCEPRLQGTAPRSSRTAPGKSPKVRVLDPRGMTLRGSATSAAVVIVVDDVADLVRLGGRDMETVLTRLVREGHKAGIHLVACTEEPNAAVISSLVKDSFPVRLVGSVASPEDAQVATGMAGTGAEELLGQGDFLIVAKGQTTRMQAAYVEIGEMCDLVRQLIEGAMPLWAEAVEIDGERGRAATTLRTLRSRCPAQAGVVSEQRPRLQLVK